MPDKEVQVDQPEASEEAPQTEEAPQAGVPVENWIQHPQGDYADDEWVTPAYAGKVYGADKKQEREEAEQESGKSPPPSK